MESSNRAASSFLSFLFLLLLLLFLFASLPCWKPAAADTAAASGRRWATACNETADAGHRCGVAVEEEDAEELQFDSEINRRLLAGTSSISYGSLNKDRATCSAGGGNPYNCGAKSPNPSGGRTCDVKYYRCQ